MKKELTMELRLLIAFLLMGAVIFVTPYFYKPTPPGPTADKTAAKPGSVTPEQAKPPAPAPKLPAEAAIPGQIQAEKDESITIDTDLLTVTFSNRGAVVRDWVLKRFKE